MPVVREAFVEALFYLAAALRAHVVAHLAGVGTADDVGRTPKLLIAPQAGYEYYGAVAARLWPARTAARADRPPRCAARPRASRRARRRTDGTCARGRP